MAELKRNASPFTINSADNYIIGGDSTGQVSIVVIELTSSSFSGSITITGRIAGTTQTPVSIPYKKRWLNGAAGDDTNVTTAITTTSLIEVDAAGLDIGISCTSYTSGSMTVDYRFLIG